MDSDDKAWLEQAIEQTSRAKATVLLINRNPDANTEMVVTNATSHEMISAMWPTEVTEE